MAISHRELERERGPTRTRDTLKAELVDMLESQASELTDACPRLDHIVSRKVYNSQLAKKVAADSHKFRLSDRIGDLARSMDSASELWLAIAECTGHEDSQLSTANVEGALECAKGVMATIVGINTAESFKGTARGREMAAAILKKSGSAIPEALRRVLQDMEKESAR